VGGQDQRGSVTRRDQAEGGSVCGIGKGEQNLAAHGKPAQHPPNAINEPVLCENLASNSHTRRTDRANLAGVVACIQLIIQMLLIDLVHVTCMLAVHQWAVFCAIADKLRFSSATHGVRKPAFSDRQSISHAASAAYFTP
jgi:hypothetical protein